MIRISIGFILGIVLSSIFILILLNKPINIPIIQAIGSIGILISAFIALISYLLNLDSKKSEIEKNQSKSNLDLSLDFLKHSYETLTSGDEKTIPKNDRLIWLTASRQILTAQKVSEEITDENHKKIYSEYENYWRTKFYSYLEQFKNDMDVRYFAEKEEHALSTPTDERQPLSEESLAVIFRFIKWQESRDDLIKSVKKFTDDEIENHDWFGFRGLLEHLQEFKNYLNNLKTSNQ